MKTRTALIAALILGLFTYSLPLYAGNTEYHVEEQTVIEIPIVGKISTRTSSYLSGCKLKENTTIKVHNTLIKMLSGSDGKTHELVLSDLCDEIVWRYDDNQEAYVSVSFEDIRAEKALSDHETETQIDMDSDQNDINNDSKVSHKILGYEKDINGFRARKVVTSVQGDGHKNPIIIEEYYSTKAKALTKITESREKVKELLGKSISEIEGVPDFINSVYADIAKDEDWKQPPGEIVRFVIRAVDEDQDPVFTMTYDVIIAETIGFEAEHFSLK